MTSHLRQLWTRDACRLGALSLLALSGCSSAYLEEDETDVVVTIKDHDRDYSQLKSYYLPNKVVDVCEAAMGGAASTSEGFVNCKPANHDLDEVILGSLRSNLDALGYRAIDDPAKETPDVAFFVGLIAQDNWFLETAPGYCYDSYFYYWGCWYPTYSYAYNLPTSTIVIDMADVSESEDGELLSAWTALLQGMQRASTQESKERRIEEGMARAFAQSPYLAQGGER